MNALEKVAWAEIGLTLLATIGVLAAYPLFGDQATKIFALLGLIMVLYPIFVWRRSDTINRDERDFAIERQAKYLGLVAAWTFLLTSIIAISMFYGPRDMPTRPVFALLWIQFAIYFGVKGMVAVFGYRGARIVPRKSEPSLRNSVREHRLNSQQTQQALADKVGVTRQTIVAMESTAYVPSLPLAIRIARAFDVTVEDVFSLDE